MTRNEETQLTGGEYICEELARRGVKYACKYYSFPVQVVFQTEG